MGLYIDRMVRNLSISLLVVMTCRRDGHLGQMPLSIVISMALWSEAYSSSLGLRPSLPGLAAGIKVPSRYYSEGRWVHKSQVVSLGPQFFGVYGRS